MTSKISTATLCLLVSVLAPGCEDKSDKPADKADAAKGGDKTAAAKGGDGDGGGAGGDATKKIAAIDVGSLASCAQMEDGTVRCWGANIEGQLGVGKPAEAMVESYTPLEVVGLAGVKALWFGESYSWGGGHSDGTTDTGCAQLGDGKVHCWGHNGNLFGNGEYKNSDKPIEIAALANITDLDSASGQACAVFSDKTAKCWGSNAFGNLGIGEDGDKKEPTPVKGLTGASEIACGQNHCCALAEAGTVSCWGYNSSGQLGNGTSDKTNAPVPVSDLTDATHLALSTNTSCAVKKDGTVACWGSNFDKTPQPVEGATGITAIDGEGFHCGLTSDKTVVCWGPNSHGQLGDGTTKDRKKVAAPVSGLANVKEVKVGNKHACALLEDSTMMCWGKNGHGQLGDGTLDDRHAPVAVVQVGSETLAPQADVPTALPTDGKLAQVGQPPPGCAAEVKLSATVMGKPIPFEVRNVSAKWNGAKLGYKLEFSNYDVDPKRKWDMPRGRQAKIKFGLEKWVVEKNEEGKERPVQKAADKAEPYTTGLVKSYRLTNAAGIYDNHTSRSFNKGQIAISHMDDAWVCGEIDLSHDKQNHALKGKFTARVAPAKK